MGQHATIHGKTATAWNGAGGKWVPVKVNSSGMMASSPIVQYAVVTSDATGLDIASGPAILYGIRLIAAGTMASVYDGITATGNVLIPSTTASVSFDGMGVVCANGITCDWTSGTWLVLYSTAV